MNVQMGKSRIPAVLLVGALAMLAAGCDQDITSAIGTKLKYPETVKIEQLDNYHGTEVSDPFRWLEDDVRESDDVHNWVEAQNAVTFAYLETLPQRTAIRERLTALWDYERFDVPFKEGGRYFFFRNDGLQSQSVLYTQASLDTEPRILIDPNSWSEDGTIALSGLSVSPDGRYVAYGIQDGGSDWRTWKLLDVESGATLDEELTWLKFTGTEWTADSAGFYYGRYPAPEEGEKFQSLNTNMKVYYHRVGSDQAEDELVYERPDEPEWGFASNVTEDGRYLVITVWKGTDDRYQIAVQDLEKAGGAPAMLINGFDNDYTLVGSEGATLYFRTNKDAPKGRLIAIDLEAPDQENWREIVGESDEVLTGASLVGGKFAAGYLRDARSEIRIFDTSGAHIRNVSLPGLGSVSGFDGKSGDSETFYSFSSFNFPTAIYRYDMASGESTSFKQAAVDFEPDDYVVNQVFYTSADGTRIPMFISHRKDLEIGPETPALLYGYGGFNISVRPGFSITRLAWMEMGGIYAVANLRGGGEYGEAWHKAGTKLQKQNVFDDFIAAGEYLIAEGYTSTPRLGIMGRSNGGLLVGAVLNQRPDLFGAALPGVGVMDMLRFHNFTAGRFWVDDYGSSDDPEEFKALYAYSPYHNIRDGAVYPPTLVTTADTDDRVVPGHSFKYIARLQEAQAGTNPVLVRIETRAGHGSGKPTKMIIEEYADLWAFLAKHLGMDPA